MMGNTFTDLILRSGPKDRVSKDGPDRQCTWPSFETRPNSAFTRVFDALWGAPQDEGWYLHLGMRAP
jgi:hypothetical protein